jgi:high-affinity iron transporter
MIATLVIGLREGLEATLIVGIIAAFLTRNRMSLRPMWFGVGAAVALSVAVGVTLDLVEQALPQAQQEGMEAVIGAVAVVFVTTMIIWMRTHARTMRRDLEAEATAAATRGTAWALAGMAFLAVLKEGFETSVFLLATFQASSSTGLAALGALIGVLAAIAIGFGIYTGGVKLDLAKFFAGTGVFLVFVAAGLVMTALRTAHEAGWVVIGQQRTVDLSWLAPNGSVRGALITGILGVQPDPRVIEVVGWFAYLVPVLALSLWPRAWRPAPGRVSIVRAGIAAGLAIAAIVLAVAVHPQAAGVPSSTTVSAGSSTGRATARVTSSAATLRITGDRATTVTFPASSRSTASHDGVTADRWRVTSTPSTARRPATVTLDQLVALFGRIPVGISSDAQPGPFAASWAEKQTTTLWTVDGGVLDTTRDVTTVVTLTGGGLSSSRTFTLDDSAWSVPAASVSAAAANVQAATTSAAELRLWNTWLPIALAIAALWQLGVILRDRRRSRRAPLDPSPVFPSGGADASSTAPSRSTYAVR